MEIHRNKLLAAVAAALSAGGMINAADAALVPTGVTPFAGDSAAAVDLEVFMGGASAQDLVLGTVMNTSLCSPGTMSTFLDTGATTPGSSHRAFFCTVPAANVPGWTRAYNVLFHKTSVGGSSGGIYPVADASAVAHMVVSSNCTGTASGSYGCTVGATGTNLRVSQAGLSDVEPSLFVGDNVPAGNSDIVPAQIDAITSANSPKSTNALIFGIVVNNRLYTALQDGQGIPGLSDVASPGEANMPSLSREFLNAATQAGGLAKWTEVRDVLGNTLTTAVDANGDGVARVPPTNTNIVICRRVKGSGTQAQFNALVANAPCDPEQAYPRATGALAGPTVVLNSSTGNLESCMLDAESKGQWAIGIMSTERNKTNALPFRYVKLDGAAPTRVNAWNGTYWDWVEQSLQYHDSIAGTDRGDLVDKIAVELANDSPAFTFTWGQAGYMKTAGTPPNTAGSVAATPIMAYRRVKGGAPRNCAVPIKAGLAGNVSLDTNY